MVIAIVALLLSLLVPVLASAREAARSVSCASNLRQLVVAADIYSTDARGFYPPGAPDFLANRTRWFGSRPSPSARFTSEGGPLSRYLPAAPTATDAGPAPARSCPTFRPVVDSLAASGRGFEPGAGSYGYNNAYVGTLRRQIDTNPMTSVVLTDRSGASQARFIAPSATIAFSDTALSADPRANAEGLVEYAFVEPRFRPDARASATGVGSATALDAGVRPDPSMHFRHAGNGLLGGPPGLANIAFLDTHVAAARRSATSSSAVYLRPSLSPALGWPGESDDNSMFDDR